MNTKIIIYGNGKFAQLVLETLKLLDGFEPVAVTADEEYIKSKDLMGLEVIELSKIKDRYPPSEFSMLTAIGYGSLRARAEAYNKGKNLGYSMPNLIAPTARTYDSLEMGENNLIFDNSYIGAYGRMGDNNIVRPNTYLGHDFDIGNHVYISPGANIAGHCKVDDLSFLGLGSLVVGGIHIANETLLGAGALLTKNTEPYGQYLGSPAKLVRHHQENGININ